MKELCIKTEMKKDNLIGITSDLGMEKMGESSTGIIDVGLRCFSPNFLVDVLTLPVTAVPPQHSSVSPASNFLSSERLMYFLPYIPDKAHHNLIKCRTSIKYKLYL